jgi:integrase
VTHPNTTQTMLSIVDATAMAAGASSWGEVLAAAVRPEFTVDTYFPERSDVILFGHPCAVDGCARRGNSRPGRTGDKWLCMTHQDEWIAAGRRPLDEWLAGGVALLTAWKRRLIPCSAAGCDRSRSCGWWCDFHLKRWIQAGRPDRETFARHAPAAPVGTAPCEVPGCRFPATRRTRRLCDSHRRTAGWCRYKKMCHDIDSFLVLLAEAELRLLPHYDFSELVEPLRSELRYVIQQRLDENRHGLDYRRVGSAAAFVAELGVDSLLDRDQEWWETQLLTIQRRDGAPRAIAFIRYARLTLARLRDRAYGVDPYSGDVWLIEALGIPEFAYQPDRTISFVGIEPLWFRDMVKRWARWRLRAGMSSPSSIAGSANVLKKFSTFLQIRGEPLSTPEALTRELLEDYRAHVRTLDFSQKYKHFLVGAMKVLLDEVRANGWEPRLAPTAAYYRREVPVTTKELPRAIDEHVMCQIEAPDNLARLTDPSTRHVVMLLIRTGLRTIDATRLPFDPVVTDAAGAPVLLYYNHKLKRDAALPIDDTTLGVIRTQQDQVTARYRDGCPWLFPAGQRVGSPEPMPGATVRHQIQRWLANGEIRDVHGRHVKVTAHQFRHTLATRMINAEVPIVAISRLLDHSSIAMTEVYAKLSDEALKREFEKYQQRVNIKGQVIPIDPDGLVSEAAWMKERIARAKQTLPNGYCGLPLQQSCPHPNACLTCDHFLTTEQFLPVHREQLAETEQLIAIAVEQGSERKREMNETVRLNLVRIIDGLEQVASEHNEQPLAAGGVSDAA